MANHKDVYKDINACIHEDIIALSEEIKENSCNCDEALYLYRKVLFNTYGQKWMTFLMEHPRIGREIRDNCGKSLDMLFLDEEGHRQEVNGWVDSKTSKTCTDIMHAVRKKIGLKQ